MPGLVKSTRRTDDYRMGGVTVALGWDTFGPTGIAQSSVDKATGKVLTVGTDAVITRHEFEENSCSYSDNTTIGNNRYPKHLLGMKLAGRTDDLNTLAKTFDLKRTTWAVATRSGEYVVLGLRGGLIAEKDDSGAGAGLDDFNGYDVVLAGGEIAKALVIDEETFNALATRVTT
jgi:hypothetical protein